MFDKTPISKSRPELGATLPPADRVPQTQHACEGPAKYGGQCKYLQQNTKQNNASDSAFTAAYAAPPIVREVLQSPGEPLDASTRSFFEPRFGYDFSKVRLHSDDKAAESARSVGALAYTVGQQIVFAQRQCSPQGIKNRALLAHELAHVQQQDWNSTDKNSLPIVPPSHDSERAAHEAAATVLSPAIPAASSAATVRKRLRASRMSRASIQRVPTWGGEWKTDKYEIAPPGKDYDLHIRLRFIPGDPVDATEIGIIQMANSIINGKAYALGKNPVITARSVPAGKRGEGSHIDQYPKDRSPLYAVTGAPAKDKHLTDTRAKKFWGQHGYHFNDDSGAPHHRDAWIDDETGLGRPHNSGQIFETTALALKGVQQGTYYGSVRWGWKTDAGGDIQTLPFEKVHDDAPSSVFDRAARIWGTTKTSKKEDVLKFKARTIRFTNADDVLLVSDPADPEKTTIAKLPKNSRAEVTSKGFGMAFDKDKTKPQWWRATVVDGPAIGKVGWVMSGSLSEKKS